MYLVCHKWRDDVYMPQILADKNPDLKIAHVDLVGSKEKIIWSQGEMV